MATKSKAVAKRKTAAPANRAHHAPAKRRSAPVHRARRTRHKGMSAGPVRTRANTLMGTVQEAAGGAAAAAILHFAPKPSFVAAVPDSIYQGVVCIAGSYLTGKFLKNKALASGMNGAAGYILTNAALSGTLMNDPAFDLADTEIIDTEDLQALEALEEGDEDESFMSETGEEVMMCEDGQYRYVKDGALYQG